MKIYIYWGAQEYFTSFEDVQNYYEQDWGCTSFNDFLSEYYTSEDIFNFTEDERRKAFIDYKKTLNDEVRDWIRDYCDIVEIEAESKKKQN